MYKIYMFNFAWYPILSLLRRHCQNEAATMQGSAVWKWQHLDNIEEQHTGEMSTYNLRLVWWLHFSGFDSLPVDSSEECVVFDVAFPSAAATETFTRVFRQQLLWKHNKLSHGKTLQKCLLKHRRWYQHGKMKAAFLTFILKTIV